MKEDKFIDIRKLIKSKNPRLLKWLPGFVVRYLERILHQDEINEFLIQNKDKFDIEFCHAIVDDFNIKVIVDGIDKIPTDERIVLVMNHPLGGLDAIALVSSLAEHRQDYKFIVNDLLLNLKNMGGLFLGVNKFGKNDGQTRNKIELLFESDETVCIFPAGKVSRRKEGRVMDLEWKKTFVTLGRKYDRKIVPIHIDGGLSNFFYRLSELRQKVGVKSNIEMLYLANEMYKQKNKTIRFSVRDCIDLKTFHPEKTDKEVTDEIRHVLYAIPN